MYGPSYAAGFSVQATRTKSSSERTKCSLPCVKNFVYFGRFIFERSVPSGYWECACASNEEKIKQREDKVFVAISEKFRLYWSVYIWECTQRREQQMLAAQPVVVQAAQPADGHPRAFTNTPKSQKGGRRIGGEYPDSGSTMDDKDRNRSLYWDHSHASTRNNAATAFEHFHKFLQHEYINAKKKLYIRLTLKM